MSREHGVVCQYGEAFSEGAKEFIQKTVCRNHPVKYKHEGKLYCLFHFPSDDKAAEFAKAFNEKIRNKDYLFYGTRFPQKLDLSGHVFTKLADFSHATFSHEVSFDEAKFFANCRFRFATFKSSASFSRSVFSKKDDDDLSIDFCSTTFERDVDFSSARFKNTVDFSGAKFHVRYYSARVATPGSPISSFSRATFGGEANFAGAAFGNPGCRDNTDSLLFSETVFERLANFIEAEFVLSSNFSKAVFKKTADFRSTRVNSYLSFEGATFEGFAKFSGKDNRHSSWPEGSLNFTSVDIERPEKISFQLVELKPDAFINTDARKFDFTDIDWKPKGFGWDWSRSKDIRFWTAETRKRRSGYERLEVAYRRLAANNEESAQYRWASNFRYTAFDIQRINRWYGRLPITLLWWYKWTSRYGENWVWAAAVLVIILAAAAFLYTKVDFYVCPLIRPAAQSSSTDLCQVRALNIYEAGRHSLATATFQNVENRKPVTGWGETFVIMEKIFAPLQAALLALAIRRKFMR